MDYDFDAIIVGGGPGGATAALVAGRLGLRVLLLDAARFPRDKICGDAIPFRALALAEELGLGEALQSVPHARAGGLSMFTRDERLRVPYAPRRLLVCRRAHFDAVLFRAAASVVEAAATRPVVERRLAVPCSKGLAQTYEVQLGDGRSSSRVSPTGKRSRLTAAAIAASRSVK